jgi:hypothetical protein
VYECMEVTECYVNIAAERNLVKDIRKGKIFVV